MGKLKCIKSALSRIYIAITASCRGDVRSTRERVSGRTFPGQNCQGYTAVNGVSSATGRFVCLPITGNHWAIYRGINLLDFDLVCLDGIFFPLDETICFIYCNRSVSEKDIRAMIE